MKILMIGLGSIGTRHLRNLFRLFQERQEPLIVDAFRSSNRPLAPDIASLLHESYYSLDLLPSDYDVAFVCNPTKLHYETITATQSKAKHFFVEKPVFSDDSVDISGIDTKGRVFYVAAPLRYTRVISTVKQIVDETKVQGVRAICSTYLPDWRPGTDYRTSYSANKEMGGGVSIDLIHEWDYLCYLFGAPEQVENIRGKCSDLELQCEDISLYIARYSDKLVSLHLDYFGRYERREVEIYTPEDTIVADIRHHQIRWLRSGKILDLPEERDHFQLQELGHFFDMIDGKAVNDNTLSEGLRTLRIANGHV